jgi:hypothetical protein
VEVPVLRLPRVALPAELRLSAGVAGPDLAPPWRLDSPDAALGLLGPPAPAVEALRLDHGVLRGVATERANGLLEPVLYARVNDAAARAVAVEAPAPLAEGGCVFRFAVPLQPSDLVEAGLAVSVHMVGLEAPIARFALAPAAGGARSGGAGWRSWRELRGLEDSMASGLEAMEHALRRRMDGPTRTRGRLLRAERRPCCSTAWRRRRAAALRAPGRRRPLRRAEATPLRLGNSVELPPDSGHLGFGWHGRSATPRAPSGGWRTARWW